MAQIIGSSGNGFGDEESENDQFPNANKTKNLKKLGGFHTFAISLPLIKGIQKKGYKTPTPIQRKRMKNSSSGAVE
ncbi:ATP-dependent RNA helicase DDX54-like isoform X1 [Lycorma delicatula]|uniref:ATP-dependent RNA helicase DDX54-like isoform X1 n=1 Tax=Lycorma delicatula TaxID=130591 RepID=UPI003F518FA2